MSKKGQKTGLSRRQELVLLSLLENPSITAAAKSSGISRNTIYKYLDDQNFASEYRKRRRQSFSAATALLNRASSIGIQKLVEMILSPNTVDTARISAIRCLLQYSQSSLEAESTAFDAAILAEELERQKNGYE
jgi:hypothetical protein